MFLRPQHFQAADRHWSELLSTSQQWDSSHNYGLRRIEISREALGNFQVDVTVCQLRMRDGSIVALDSGSQPDRLSLQEAFTSSTEVTVYLGIPKLVLGRPNVSRSASANGELIRYSQSTVPVAEEAQGGNSQEVEFRHLNAKLLLREEEGFETLPIAKIRRASNDQAAVPELSDDFFPPMVSIDAWEPLSIGLVRRIYDKIGVNIELISQRVSQRGINLTSQTPGDLDDLLKLSVLNQVYAVLHVLTNSAGIHPFQAYTELCRCVGMLSIFSATHRVANDMPAYDHDDLARIFRWIERQINQLLGTNDKANYEQRTFIGAGQGMEVKLEDEWLSESWDWFVGVKGTNISNAEIRVILQPGKLAWKMGCSSRIDMIHRYGMPGVVMKDLEAVPRTLPPNQGWVYYEVFKDLDNASWRDVVAENTLALRFVDHLIGNLAGLTGQQQLEVVLPDKRTTLEFSLFAVPR